MLAEIQELAPVDMPEQAGIEQMLTPEEAYRWDQEWATIKGALLAKEALRHERRQDELPKGVGRPKGAKTGTGKAAKTKD
jgi:hypothetical protein